MNNLLMSWLIRKKEHSHKHWKQKMGKRNARFGSISLVRQPVLQQKQRNPKSSRSQQREREQEKHECWSKTPSMQNWAEDHARPSCKMSQFVEYVRKKQQLKEQHANKDKHTKEEAAS